MANSDVMAYHAVFVLTDGAEYVETSLEPFPATIKAHGGHWQRTGETRGQHEIYRYVAEPGIPRVIGLLQ